MVANFEENIGRCNMLWQEHVANRPNVNLDGEMKWEITDFRREVAEACDILRYYTAKCGDSSLTSWPLKIGPIGCPETSLLNYHATLRNIPKGRMSHYAKFDIQKAARFKGFLDITPFGGRVLTFRRSQLLSSSGMF